MSQPQTTKPSKRRRNYLIDPALQWKHALSIALIVFMVSALISVGIYGTLHQQARLRAADPVHYVGEVTTIILCFAIGCAALTAGGVGLWSIIVTHRMCGPMYVMERCLKELTAGRLPKLRALRKNDEFKEFYNTFGDAIESIRRRAQTDLGMVCGAIELANQGFSKDSELDRQRATSLVAQLEKLRGDLECLLSEGSPEIAIDANNANACDKRLSAHPVSA